MALRPAAAKRSSTANEAFLSAVQPNTLPPRTSGAMERSVRPRRRSCIGCLLLRQVSVIRWRNDLVILGQKQGLCADDACARRLPVRSIDRGFRCPRTRFGSAALVRGGAAFRRARKLGGSDRGVRNRAAGALPRAGAARILSLWNMRDYWTPPVASPTAAYHDVIIAYDEKRYLNNGQPSLGRSFRQAECGPGRSRAPSGVRDGLLHRSPGGTGRSGKARFRRSRSTSRSRSALERRSRRGPGHGRQRRWRERFVLEVRRRGRQRRSDPPDAGLARLPQAGGTARLSDDDSEQIGRDAARETPRARRF